jgi:hypothetical protein
VSIGLAPTERGGYSYRANLGLSLGRTTRILPFMNFTKNIGMLLLAIYLILVGLMTLAGFVITPIVMGILALLAGIFILIGK